MPDGKKLSHWQETIVLGLLLLAAPLLLVGSLKALQTNSNDPRQWLPSSFEEAERYDWLQQHFGSDEITVVSWPGCSLDDPRVNQMATALVEESAPSYFERVITGPQVFRELISKDIGLSTLVARQRLRGTLIGPDGETTCLVLYLASQGGENRPQAIEHVYATAEHECGISRDELRLGGPTVDAAAIDVESQRMLIPLAGLSVMVAFLITWRQFANFRLAVIVLAGAIYSAALGLTILYITGGHMNLVMTMLPPLVYVLTISTSIHLVNYYRDAVEETGLATASYRALVLGWKPCALASGTTAFGLLSLATSDIQPVRMFGIYASIGVALGLVVTLLLLPAALTVWPPKLNSKRCVPGDTADRQGPCAVANAICRWRGVLTIASLGIMIAAGIGLIHLKSTVSLQYRFGEDSRIIADYQWLESNVGPLVPLELVLDFPPGTTDHLYDRMTLVDRVQRRLADMHDVGATVSAANFIPHMPTGRSFAAIARRSYLRRQLEENQQNLYDAHWVADGESGHQLWRITIRADALRDIDFGHFTDELKQRLDPMLDAHPEVKATYTGMIPLFYKAQRELLSDLVESFLLAFGMIAVVMMVVLGSATAGLLTMLPNVFPVVVTFGLMGWGDVWIEIGTVMTASAALGIAVDDTFHYLTWFRRGISDGLSRGDAVKFAHGRCAMAMTQTTLICACGLIVFSLSSFMPIVRFSRLMATLLVAALVGDLIFLPAILASPLGKLVANRCRPADHTENATATTPSAIEPASAKAVV